MFGLHGGGSGGAIVLPWTRPVWLDFWFAEQFSDFTLSGTDVIAWAGRKGARTFTDLGNAAQRPRRNAGVIGGKASVQCDGVAQWLQDATLDLAYPVFYWFLLRQNTSVSFETIICGNPSTTYRAAIYQTGSGNIAQNGGISSNAVTLATGNWGRLESYFSAANDGTSYQRLNDAAPVAGGNPGLTDPAVGVALGSRNGAASTFAGIDVAAFGIALSLPGATDLQIVRDWSLATFGV